MALLGKWWWKLRVDSKSLWSSVLKVKYKGVGMCDRSCSTWWKDILSLYSERGKEDLNWIESNTIRKIGDGSNTMF